MREWRSAVEIVVDNLVDRTPSQAVRRRVAFAADSVSLALIRILRPEPTSTQQWSEASRPCPNGRPRLRAAVSTRCGAPDAAPDVVEFIRFCHRRRHVGWPDLYDEMCAVAARREFNGWDHDQLAEHGLTFCLTDMPRLAGGCGWSSDRR